MPAISLRQMAAGGARLHDMPDLPCTAAAEALETDLDLQLALKIRLHSWQLVCTSCRAASKCGRSSTLQHHIWSDAGADGARSGRAGTLLVPASSEAGFLSAMLNGVVGLISEPIRCRHGRKSPPLPVCPPYELLISTTQGRI